MDHGFLREHKTILAGWNPLPTRPVKDSFDGLQALPKAKTEKGRLSLRHLFLGRLRVRAPRHWDAPCSW